MSRPGKRLPWAAAVALAFAASGARGTEVKTFQLQTQKAFLAGTFEGVSVDPLGRLELADRARRVTGFGEPFLFAAAPHPEGWVVGTGNDGKVLQVSRDGEVTELFAAPEGQVFAVAAAPDGTVYAGASPGGKVYRIPPEGEDGEAEPWYETGQTYVWDLALEDDGSLLVATGTSGKLFRVRSRGAGGGDGAGKAEGEEVYDSGDTHARAVSVLPGGDVLLGTAGEGLVLRISADGSVRTLYDAAQPEVVAFARRSDGTLYAAAIASEASSVDLSKPSAGDGADDDEDEPAAGKPGVTVEVSPAGAVGSRPTGFQGQRAQLLSISPSGVVESVWSFDEETVFDLLWERDRLWVATGLEGKLYGFDGEQMVLEKDLDERQIVALLPGGEDAGGPAFATTNAPALYRLTGEKERRGTYTSAALDAGAVARFGTLRWHGRAPRGTEIAFSFRSGVSSEPDATWSEWTSPREPSASGEVALDGVPNGRYVQWRATLTATERAASPRVASVELTYRQENLRPRVTRFRALDPGEILVPAGFNPTTQVFEPVSPNREGIFTTLEQAAATPEGRTKTLWKKGYRTFQWEVNDPNRDALAFALHFRRMDQEGGGTGGDLNDGGWMPVAEELEQDHFSFDSTALPDGLYRFRLTASDAEANPPEEGLVAEELSEPVVIDHSPPALVEAGRRSRIVRVVLEDAWNPLRSVEVSLDAGEWRPAPAADGLLDARREVLELPAPEGAKLLLLRATDAAFNVITYDLSDRLR